MSIAVNAGPARGGNVASPLVGTPTVQAAPTPADKPRDFGAPPPASRFAELLRRNRAEAPKPVPTMPARPPGASSDDGVDTGESSAIEAKAAPANAAKARASTAKETTGKPTAGDDEQRGDDRNVASHDRRDPGDDSERSERSAAPLLPVDRLDSRPMEPAALDGLNRPAFGNPRASDQAADDAAADDRDAAAAGTTAKHTLGHARAMASVDAANDRHAALVDRSRDTGLRVATDARFEVAHAETSAAFEAPTPPAAHERATEALAASLGLGAPSPSLDATTAPRPSTALALPTPIDAPDFAAALGVRVSVLVQDGVQQAELHLNPAETGPVSIHITLDGTAARVDFGADLAATRAAIERGLPELASALRDAGFTLAGGGVSQHAGGRAGDDGSPRRSSPRDGAAGSGATSIGTPSRTIVRTIRAGRIDLYA